MNRVIFRDVGSRAQVLSETIGELVVGVAEAGAPVAEVGAHDEDVGGVGKVGCEVLAKFALGGGICGADHDWNEGDRGRIRFEAVVVARVDSSVTYVGKGCLKESYRESIL